MIRVLGDLCLDDFGFFMCSIAGPILSIQPEVGSSGMTYESPCSHVGHFVYISNQEGS